MANPLQPKCIKVLETEFEAFVINATATSKSGIPDLVCSIKGLFYGFEIKWKTDRPSEVQKTKINKIIDSGGKAYFIDSVGQLRHIVTFNITPTKYELKNKFIL